MSETNQKEKSDRTAGIQNKLQGKFFLKSDTAKRLYSPWAVYIPIAVIYSSASIWQIATVGYGRSALLPAFCLPGGFCYPALPFSLIMFSGFLLWLVRRWGWKAGPMIVMAAASYDAFAGGLVSPLTTRTPQSWPVDGLWIAMIVIPFLFVKPIVNIANLKVVFWLWFTFVGWYFFLLLPLSGAILGVVSETFSQLLFFLAFDESVTV